MSPVTFNSPSAPQPSGGYSQAVAIEAGRRLLFISGQIPESAEGIVPPDFRSQCRQVWANVIAQLEAAGMSARNLVKVTTFLASREHAGENSTVRREVLGSCSPALTVVIAGIFDEQWLVEIEAVAAD